MEKFTCFSTFFFSILSKKKAVIFLQSILYSENMYPDSAVISVINPSINPDGVNHAL